MKKALVVYGGWPGHSPKETGTLFATELEKRGYSVHVSDTLSIYENEKLMSSLDLIVPFWTMGQLSPEQHKGLLSTVRNGCGLAGVHGGMCDSFHGNHEYNWMTGGRFVSHPYSGEYAVNIVDSTHPAMDGMPPSFTYNSEQYYMMYEPSIRVLATTIMDWDDQRITMPVVWIKRWGRARVFYSSLGHRTGSKSPLVLEMTMRGFVWATR